jgi:PIN domain nuclease of toxin-antitoxin system
VTLVLDASAVIAFLRDEPGADTVRALLEAAGTESTAAVLSAVNLTEVVQELGSDLPALIDGPEPVIATIPFAIEHARAAAAMLPPTRSAGLGLADRACLALAKVTSLPVLTADRAWSEIDLDVEVVQIR